MFLLALLACDGEFSSSTCSYESHPGTCTFTEVTADSSVVFRYDESMGAGSESVTLLIGDEGEIPDQACIDELGVAIDYVTDCDKQVLSEAGGDGDCDEVQWEFSSIDPEDCEH